MEIEVEAYPLGGWRANWWMYGEIFRCRIRDSEAEAVQAVLDDAEELYEELGKFLREQGRQV